MTDFPNDIRDVTAVTLVTGGNTHIHVYAERGSLSYIYTYDSDISDKRDIPYTNREISVTGDFPYA